MQPRLIGLSKHKNGFNSVNPTGFKLKSGLVVVGHILKGHFKHKQITLRIATLIIIRDKLTNN